MEGMNNMEEDYYYYFIENYKCTILELPDYENLKEKFKENLI